jgi:hypothetical protein
MDDAAEPAHPLATAEVIRSPVCNFDPASS